MEIARKIRVVFKDRLIATFAILALLLQLAAWTLFLLRKVNYSELSVVHTNIYLGIDVLAHWLWLFLIPIGALAISIFDSALTIYLWTRNRLWTYYLILSVFFLNFLTFLYLYHILNFNLA